jgi:AraC-like DNA-binding protein
MANLSHAKGAVRLWSAGSYGLQLVRLAARWHVSAEELLDGLGVNESELAEPGTTLSVETLVALCERARALTREPGLGFYWGLSQRATAHGYPGFAAMSAETYGQCLDLAIRYVPLLTTMFSLRLEVQKDLASLIVDEHAAPTSARDMLLICVLVGLRQLGADFTAMRLNASIDLSISEPDYYACFAELVPGIRFEQALNRMVFEPSALALQLSMADPAALRLVGEQCERALEVLEPEETVVARVRQSLVGSEGLRSLRKVASDLHLSPRGLKTLLAKEQTSFTELVNQERREMALRLLTTSRLVLKDVAAQLGYSSVSNFARAFHRWTGQTPAAYRRRMRASRRRR